jgi:hypothetical protein
MVQILYAKTIRSTMRPGTTRCISGSVLRKAAMMEAQKKKPTYKPPIILSHPLSVKNRK